MTPERIRGWLRKPRGGAKRVALVVDNIAGITPIADWNRDEACEEDTDPDNDVATAIVAQCQEYTNSEQEPQKFRLRWLGPKDRVLGQTTHLCTPKLEQPSDGLPGVLDTNVLVRELLIASREKDKTIIENLSTITGGYKETILVLSEQLKQAYKLLREEVERKPETVEAQIVELTEEQKEESIQRGLALQAFTTKLPDIIDAGLAVVATKWVADVDGKPTVQ